ncbi:MAG: EamA family transporter [Terricaulis sp.]
MSANDSATTPAIETPQRTQWFDLAAIVVCTLAWGTTWFAITKQLGVVDPVVSVTYRFALAAVLLFAWGALRREKLALTRAQHFAALGVGFVFAAMAFMNLIVFRFAFNQRAPLLAWAAGGLGVLGVGFLSWEEISSAELSNRALAGISLTLAGVLSAAIGNVYARKGEMAGAGVIASTGWAMGYGAAMLAVFAVATGKTWAFEFTAPYIVSLLHLSLVGSVIAFALYYGLARRRGYATASYISALTPPLAMFVSAMFEDKSWGVFALGGVVLVLAGQVLLLRSKRAA